ncbi:MAG: hypothetical protein H8K03_14525 [Nitrospira sp.]|jgi:hypothetical protein|nr:hypothetical protein [Nitrospira sp. BO4]
MAAFPHACNAEKAIQRDGTKKQRKRPQPERLGLEAWPQLRKDNKEASKSTEEKNTCGLMTLSGGTNKG